MFQDLGASIGPVLVATILASFTGVFNTGISTPAGPITARLPTLMAFHWLFAAGALLSLTSGILAGFLHNYTFDASGARSASELAVPEPAPVPPTPALGPE